jgi:RAT1-interacting protein
MKITVVRQTITTEGTWRISRKKGSPQIVISKLSDQGTGDILSTDFVNWRTQLLAQEVAQMLK